MESSHSHPHETPAGCKETSTATKTAAKATPTQKGEGIDRDVTEFPESQTGTGWNRTSINENFYWSAI